MALGMSTAEPISRSGQRDGASLVARVAARLVDGASLLLLALAIVGLSLPAWYGRAPLTVGALMLLLFLALHVAVETVCLVLWGRTPGKALCGLSVQASTGGRLPLDVAAARSGRVVVQGLGLWLLPLTLITGTQTMRLLRRGASAPWDDSLHTQVLAESVAFRQVLGWGAVVLLTGVFAIAGWTKGLTSFGENGGVQRHTSLLLTRLTGQWVWVNKLTGRAAVMPGSWRLLSESTPFGLYVARFVHDGPPRRTMDLRYVRRDFVGVDIADLLDDWRQRGMLVEVEGQRTGKDLTVLVATTAFVQPLRAAFAMQRRVEDGAWNLSFEVELTGEGDEVWMTSVLSIARTFESEDGTALPVAAGHYWLNARSGQVVQLPPGWEVAREMFSPQGHAQITVRHEKQALGDGYTTVRLARVPNVWKAAEQYRRQLADTVEVMEVTPQRLDSGELLHWKGVARPTQSGSLWPPAGTEQQGELVWNLEGGEGWGWIANWETVGQASQDETMVARRVALILLESALPARWWTAWGLRP